MCRRSYVYIYVRVCPSVYTQVVSDRAIKHVNELTLFQELGAIPGEEDGSPVQCAVLFIVQRADCAFFRPCDEADPLFANVVKHAQDKGRAHTHTHTQSHTIPHPCDEADPLFANVVKHAQDKGGAQTRTHARTHTRACTYIHAHRSLPEGSGQQCLRCL